MKFKELDKKYGFHETLEEVMERLNSNATLNPIYSKHLPACWIIQEIYEQFLCENMSAGKARELVAAVIEEHIKTLDK